MRDLVLSGNLSAVLFKSGAFSGSSQSNSQQLTDNSSSLGAKNFSAPRRSNIPTLVTKSIESFKLPQHSMGMEGRAQISHSLPVRSQSSECAPSIEPQPFAHSSSYPLSSQRVLPEQSQSAAVSRDKIKKVLSLVIAQLLKEKGSRMPDEGEKFGTVFVSDRSLNTLLVPRQSSVERAVGGETTQASPVGRTSDNMTNASHTNNRSFQVTSSRTYNINKLSPSEKLSQIIGSADQELLDFLDNESIDSDAPLYHFGFDSITAVEFAEKLSTMLDLHLEPIVIFQYPTVNDLILFLQEQLSRSPSLDRMRRDQLYNEDQQNLDIPTNLEAGFRNLGFEYPQDYCSVSVLNPLGSHSSRSVALSDSLVVVSAVCQCPNRINNLSDLWKCLIDKRDCIDEVPLDR